MPLTIRQILETINATVFSHQGLDLTRLFLLHYRGYTKRTTTALGSYPHFLGRALTLSLTDSTEVVQILQECLKKKAPKNPLKYPYSV